jgi:hypothetical protein
MRFSSSSGRVGLALAVLTLAPAALAQQPPPLPPPQQPPPPGYQPPPPGYQQPPPGYQQPPPGYQQQPPPGYQQPPPGYQQQPPPGYYPPPQQPQYYPQQPAQRQPPPPVEYVPPDPPTHAPKFSLWLGTRVSYMGFGFAFFDQKGNGNAPETTGNFVGNGVAPQFDLGARLAHKYVPYVFWEHGFMGQGHRFSGTDATSSTDFYGLGFRFGGADDVGFISDLSVGKRIVRVSRGSDTYEMSGLEIFKLGLGAEFRLQTLFTIEVMGTVSGGSMTDTSGTVQYGTEGAKDGVTQPDFRNGDLIANARTYVNLTLGVGIHFDVFGK